MADIFVSYATQDRGFAEDLVHALIRSGWAVWFDRGTPRRSNAGDELREELGRADCVLVLWSRRSLQSMWVLSQARQAMQSHKYLPAFIEAVTLPDEFARFQALDMSKWRGSDNAPEIRDLSEAVRHVVTSRTKADSKLPSRATAQGPVLFLCYRREDTQDAAGRLHDRLVDAYGAERVFIDIDSVPLGIDFVEHVAEQIGKCNAVIVMIGKKWHAIKDKKRRRRLDNEDDLVRAEIRAALQQKIPVIPVTVQNATMPHAEDLPDDIRLLARRNGIQLDAARWRTDVERLIKELDRVMKPSSSNS